MSPNLTQKKSRADIVRARRQIEQTPKKPQPRQVVNTSDYTRKPQPRVTTRKTSSGQSKIYYGNSSARRNVYMPLQTGAEMKLPPLPNFKIGWRLASFILAALMLVLVIGMREMPIFQVTKINLSGAERVGAEEIFTRLELVDMPIVELIPSEIEQELLNQFHDFKSAKVKLGLPSVVSITVEERLPAVVWTKEDGTSQWIDEEGYLFPVRGEATLPVSVQAIGDAPRNPGSLSMVNDPLQALLNDDQPLTQTPDVDPSFVNAILTLRNVLPAETTMLYEPSYGLGWYDPRGWNVYFGTQTSEIIQKLAEYEVIVTKLQEKSIQPTLISLEFLHAPFYRVEQ